MGSKSLRHFRIIAVMAFAIALGATAVASFADNAAAGSGPLPVFGYVYDVEGTPIEGASVVVEVLASGATLADTTDSSGRYDVTFDLSDWETGNTIEATATYDSQEDTESGVAPAFGTLQIDIQFSFAIPEFGSFPGVVIATVLVGSVALMSMRRRRAQ